MASRVERALRQGIAFVKSQQQADGRFVGYSWPHGQQFKPGLEYSTIFTPSLILSSLQAVDLPQANTICKPLADWLIGQKSALWSFNYWAKDAPQRKSLPYPHNLDVTFCVLLALHQYNSSLVDGQVLAKMVQVLLATEQKVGGPYKTWLVDAKADKIWQDIDVAVNANVQAVLARVAQPLPNLSRLFERRLARGAPSSSYYPSAFPIWYYLSRIPAEGLAAERVIAQLQAAENSEGHWGAPLNTALAVSALSRLGQPPPQSVIDFLLNSQAADGSWPAEAFCIDPSLAGQKHVHGARALTTAFALEALSLSAVKSPKAKVKAARPKIGVTADDVFVAARQHIESLPQPLRGQTTKMIAKMQAANDAPEIVLLPKLFAESLVEAPELPKSFLVSLGLANLFGWIAYIIYDDFLDDEGDARQLSVANVALRESILGFYRTLPDKPDFLRLVQASFNAIDGANAWEVARCRFPVASGVITIGRMPRYGRHGKLAERSLGHALTPLGVLAAQGINLDSPAVNAVRRGLMHYLIARQLGDDLHDWQDDLRQGHVSAVVAEVLKSAGITHGQHRLDELIPHLQKHFWHQAIQPLCQLSARYVSSSRRALRMSKLLKPENVIAKLLDRQQNMLNRTLTEQQKAKDFLKTYNLDK